MRMTFIRVGFHEGGFYQEGFHQGGLLVLLVMVEGVRDFKTAATYCSTGYTYSSTSPTQSHG